MFSEGEGHSAHLGTHIRPWVKKTAVCKSIFKAPNDCCIPEGSEYGKWNLQSPNCNECSQNLPR